MSRADWSMMRWRDHYEKLRLKAEENYQTSGLARYDNEEMKYDIIVTAFNGYLEHKNEADNEKIRRIHNINEYCKNNLYKDTYTVAEVQQIINVIKYF